MKIVHADAHIVVVDKPGGLLAVPGRGPEKQDCVESRLRRRFVDMPRQPAVHRLDMATSGLMVLARTPDAHRNLSMQFAERNIDKEYVALLDGRLSRSSGRIELKFRLDTGRRPYQIYDPGRGKLGITLWWKIGEEAAGTRVLFKPLTGRTHQLRLHAAHDLGLGCPIQGDALYGRGRQGERMMLHASSLTLVHPYSGIRRTFTAAIPF